jgi:peroxiredoxin family protein
MARPDPAFVTAIEDLAELVDNLSPQGVLLTSCPGAAKIFGMNTLAAINGIVTGAAGMVAIPARL